ncbi:MAG: glycosyltransferase family 2 protein [Pirellulaceae bacterium]
MVVTRAPSEPFSVVRPTLDAMLAQRFPHDTWLADEDPTEEVERWCVEHGVFISTRKNAADYHRDCWPRRAKCKEGNLAYFYDHYGYDLYDFVAQLDADHVPEAGYLEAILRPFLDDTVGYVSAPSICDKNASTSWTARGRLFSEAVMHGPLQSGYSDGFAPLCIGSHYAVRTTALRHIGGLGPELAEDHSTTLLMNACGWRGVHSPDALAHGDGPATLADCITQEFQWSRSLVVILLTVLPKCWGRLSWRLRVQFLFSELWYPLFGGSMLLGVILPVWAILTRQPWVNVSYAQFLVHTLPLCGLSIAVQAYLKRLQLLRPVAVPLLNWEVGLFQLIRWPWVVIGTLAGVWVAVRNAPLTFRVTPKGECPSACLSWRLLNPYVAIVVATFLPLLLVPHAGAAHGYYFFLIFDQVLYTSALLAIVLIHYHETTQRC